MNYIELINQFWQTRRIVSFSSKESDLYFALLNECNIRNWENPFECSNRSLVATTGISEKTLIDVRNRLKQKGLIDFKPGKRKAQSPVYILLNYKKESKKGSIGESKKESKYFSKKGNSLKTETEINKISLSWRNNFEVYLEDLKNAFQEIISDKQFIRERERYHPGVNILLTLEKAYVDYWSKEVGWLKKKAASSGQIDWRTTFSKAIDLKQNKVWLAKGEKNRAEEDEIVYV